MIGCLAAALLGIITARDQCLGQRSVATRA